MEVLLITADSQSCSDYNQSHSVHHIYISLHNILYQLYMFDDNVFFDDQQPRRFNAHVYIYIDHLYTFFFGF